MAHHFTIGIDLGGTNIKAGVLDAHNRPVFRTTIETQAEAGFQHVFDKLVKLIADLHAQPPLNKVDRIPVGIGVPGPMSHAQGLIHSAPNMPGWINIPLRTMLHDATGLPVNVENDANAAAYGEFIAGAGVGTRELVMLTLGTGIGGGLVIGGRLQRGFFDNAGEIGHMIVELDGRPCPCGQRGCLERYASATAIATLYCEASVNTVESGISAAEVAERARMGDPHAKTVWDSACRYLAIACINLQHVLNPELVIFSGGLIGAGDQLLSAVQAHFNSLTWNAAKDFPKIKLAALGGDAGWLGAAALAQVQFPD